MILSRIMQETKWRKSRHRYRFHFSHFWELGKWFPFSILLIQKKFPLMKSHR
uniref:Uncharacterized protein n=1 Tax=Picea sitchensis TaxID=3332 RepID=A9P151_PICSI|nr:unknown [Picea sitchensis]